jgi:hypothetical protein
VLVLEISVDPDADDLLLCFFDKVSWKIDFKVVTDMTSTSNYQSAIIRTERGLTIAGTRITLYDVMDYVGKDSREQVMREENTSESLPVITVSNADQLLNDSEYRGRCVESLVKSSLILIPIEGRGESSFRSILKQTLGDRVCIDRQRDITLRFKGQIFCF